MAERTIGSESLHSLHESFWLLHVDLLFEITVKECCLHVQLFYLEVHAGYYTQHRSDGGHLYYRGKYLVEVHTLLLLEPLHHDLGLVSRGVSDISRF